MGVSKVLSKLKCYLCCDIPYSKINLCAGAFHKSLSREDGQDREK